LNINKKIEKLQKQGINSNCYYLINSKDMIETIDKCSNDKKKLEYFYNLCEGWDLTKEVIPLEIGVSLEKMVNDSNIRVGIHRSSVITDKNDQVLKYIMQNGLRNDAQITQGATHVVPDLTKTISFVNNMFHTVPMIKGSYKGSNGAIILTFPTEYLDLEGNVLPEFINEIYEETNGIYYVRPEFIVGYLVAEYGVYNLYTKEDILNREEENNANYNLFN